MADSSFTALTRYQVMLSGLTLNAPVLCSVTISGNIDFINLGDTNFTLTLDLDRILTLTDNY